MAGAFFALEVLLKGVKLKWIAITFSVSIIATLIARLGLGNIHQYSVSLQMTSFWGVLTFAVFTGPVFAFAAHWFVNMTSQARMNAPKQGKIIFYCLTNFILLGLLLIPLPELAGNGKSAAQVSFNGQITLQYALFLLIAKVFVEWGSLRAGAKGGLLTPSFANGALISLLLSVIWRHFFPEIELGVFAIIGAATFLSIANKMPLTAIAITLEMTQIEFLFVLPIATCVFIAWLTKHYFLPKEGIESY